MDQNNILTFPNLKQPEAWEDPILFDDWETPEIQAQWLPGVFGEWAEALALATETPQALSVMTILGVLSAILMQRVVISPKAHWFEPINIYTLIALPPANHKSIVLKYCTQPLLAWEREQEAQLGAEIRRLRSERKTQEKLIERLRVEAAKEKNHLEQRKLIEQVTELEASLSVPPVLPVLFVNDATPESLAIMVHEQGGRLGLFSDEGGLLETLAGLYSQGTANIDILLKGIDGGEMRVRRKDRGFSLKPYLTVVMMVQPAIVQQLAEKKAYRGNGALERFLYVMPQSKLGYRTHSTPPIPEKLQQAYDQRIQFLLQSFLPVDRNVINKPIILTLSVGALSAWRAYQAELEIQLRPGEKFEYYPGWAGKMSGFALRIAGLLHVAEYDTAACALSETTMLSALAIAQALGDHALAAFGMMGADQSYSDAKMIFRWINTLSQPTFTQSELTYAWRHRKWGSTRLIKALNILQERHLVSQPVKVPTRKPTHVYYIHPNLVKT
jgi:uncharacterized protein DUF3987